ncbi:MAG: sensor histidine kinase [Pirellulaceae bacterium]
MRPNADAACQRRQAIVELKAGQRASIMRPQDDLRDVAMKWPLKYQVLVPMALVMLGTIAALTALHAYLAVEQSTGRIADRIEDVTRTLATASYPLTEGVLRQLQGLAGADFVLVDHQGRVLAATRPVAESLRVALSTGPDSDTAPAAAPLQVAGERFIHQAVAVTPPRATDGVRRLHVLYPEQSYRRERRAAMVPPLIIGGVALVVVTLLAMTIASRVTRPLAVLRKHVQRIAQGDFRPGDVTGPDDEVHELARNINHMAQTLVQYEKQIRHAEQARTLTQLSGGLAHQLRNAVTGARMALDLHRAECPRGSDDESLDVAVRQLVLIEQYLQRFLMFSGERPGPCRELDLCELIAEVLPLVQPAARHTSVELVVDLVKAPQVVRGDCDALGQLVLNLLWNGIEAAGQMAAAATPPRATVWIRVSDRPLGFVTLAVMDTGPGPPPDVAPRMFEPFISGKRDGIGLGLAVAKEVVDQHGGTISWRREEGKTMFEVRLPLVSKGL